MQKKIIALLMSVALVLGVFNTFCVAYAADCSVDITNDNGAFVEHYGSADESLSDGTLESKVYPVKNGMVYAYPGITVAQLVSVFSDNTNVSVTDNKQAVESSSKVKSGVKIALKSRNMAQSFLPE